MCACYPFAFYCMSSLAHILVLPTVKVVITNYYITSICIFKTWLPLSQVGSTEAATKDKSATEHGLY